MYEELVKRLLSYADLHCPLDRAAGICGCIDAREAAEAILELRKPRWIPVTERLPEMGKEVLVSDKHKGINIAWIVGCFSKDGASFEWACESDGWIDDQLPITHWMPLPEPPKEET